MKRPLVLVGLCYLLTLAAAVSFGASVSAVLFWVLLAAFAATLFWRRTRRAVVFPLACITAAAALGAFCIYSHAAVEPPRTLDGKTVAVQGTVCELPQKKYNRWYYIIRVDKIAGTGVPAGFKVRLSSQNGIDAAPYSRISGNFHFFLPSGGEAFSSRGYYASKGIMMSAYAQGQGGLTVQPPAEKPPYYYALRMRQKLLQSVKTLLPPEEASLVNGILLGEQSGLSAETAADFRTDGISHILSVSGLHLSAIAQLLIFLLLFLRVPKRTAAITASLGVFGFMAVTCFVPSVTRSGMMCLMCLAAPFFSRRADPLNSLCTAALLLCLANPYAAADIGLLLSFFATLGLVLCAGPIANFLNRKFDRVHWLSPLVRAVSGILATSAAASLFTLPIILLSFGTVSLAAPLANLLELVPSTVLIVTGAAAALFGLFPQTFLAKPFALAAGLTAKYMQHCAAWIASLPFASISASQGFVTLWLAGTILLLAVAFALGKGKRLFPQSVCLSVILLVTGIFSFQLSRQDVTRLTVMDVGDGVSAVLTRGGHAAVIGCRDYNSAGLVSCLNSESIGRLDCLEVLTEQRDEFSCAAEAADRFLPVQFAAQQKSAADGYLQEAAAKSTHSTPFATRAEMSLWSNVKIETRYGKKAAAARITACGVTIVLVPKGVGSGQLPEDWNQPDFLVTDNPTGNEEVSPACNLYSVSRRMLEKSSGKIQKTRAVWTAGYGNIVLTLKDGRIAAVGRER